MKLPNFKGTLISNFSLKELTFFGVGGKCDLFCIPESIEDLQNFLAHKIDMDIICLGAMSNVLILDSGFRGCIVSTTDSFRDITFFENNTVKVSSGVSLSKFIMACIEKELSCCEQMFCIPGTVGGAIYMNAGIPSFEIFDVLIEIHCIDFTGASVILSKKDIKYAYRNGNIPKNLIITSCLLKTSFLPKGDLENTIRKIKKERIQSQPIGEKTCGSTFKNPPGMKAWQLIDSSGCRGMRCGGASLSGLHCNFIINDNQATSKDILGLINNIKERVFKHHGIMLEEEIKIIGNKND